MINGDLWQPEMSFIKRRKYIKDQMPPSIKNYSPISYFRVTRERTANSCKRQRITCNDLDYSNKEKFDYTTGICNKRSSIRKQFNGDKFNNIFPLSNKNSKKSVFQISETFHNLKGVSFECIQCMSPFQGDYKIINKKIIWKPKIEFQTKRNFYHPKEFQDIKPKSKLIINTPTVIPSTEIKIEVKCGYYSLAGKISKKISKVNQDRVALCPQFCGKDNLHLFIIADGHGAYGDNVSSFVVDSLKRIDFQ